MARMAEARPTAGDPATQLRLAVEAHQAGRLDEAEAGYTECAQCEGVRVPALYYGGLLAMQRKDYPVAISRLAAVTALASGRHEAWHQLGVAYGKAGMHEQAEACYRRVIVLAPAFVDAYRRLGNLLRDIGRPAEAVQILGQARALDSRDFKLLLALGNALIDVGRAADAVDVFHRAAELAPVGNIDALVNLGASYHQLKDLDQAIATYRKALKAVPDDADLLSNLAEAELENGNSEASRELYGRLAAKPATAGLKFRLATLLPAIADSEAQITAWRAGVAAELQALREDPPTLDDPFRQVGDVPFHLSYHGREDDRELLTLLAQAYLRACPGLAYTAPHCAAPHPSRQPPRIGFISRYFRDHSVGKTMAGIIAGVARADFEVHVLCLPPVIRDERLGAIIASAHRHHELPNDLARARQAIAALELDILVYADIGMEPLSYFLAFARLAPVQCVTWGHPVTTGVPNVDYYLSHADLELPDSQRLYSETLVRIGHGPIYPGYPRPPQPQPMKTRAELGLPENRTIFMCPQSAFKFLPGFDEPLGAILGAVPDAILLVPEPRHAWIAARLRARWRRVVPECAERIRFFPHVALPMFCNLVAVSDVLLDTFPVGGGVSTFDSLRSGTPVVTLAGGQMRSRFAGACLQQMGFGEWISPTSSDYVDRAVSLARDKDLCATTRQALTSAAESWLYENDIGIGDYTAFFASALRQGR